MQTLHALLSDPGALFNGSIHCVDSPPSIIRFVSFRYYPETPALYCIVLYCIVLYCIVLYWFEAAPPAAADKGFARFRSYVPT